MTGQAYRLPFGSYTKNLDEYDSAWNALAEKVMAFFPGYVVHSRGPNLKFVKYSADGLGVMVVDQFSLSPDAIVALTRPTKVKVAP